jgi:hypothetical protein
LAFIGEFIMLCKNITIFLNTVIMISSCGFQDSSSEKINVVLSKDDPSLTNLRSKVFYATKNVDGSFSTFVGTWVVPPYVKSVKIIGCSGGNGGGGGGAGGAGSSGSNASRGGNGSFGGAANGIFTSGIAGQVGSVGKYKDGINSEIYDANSTAAQANSATQSGENGDLGGKSIFGNYVFSSASENNNNRNNLNLFKNYIDFNDVCLGGVGGTGGAGGVGGKYINDNIITNPPGVSRYLFGGLGGNGGNGQIGFHALVEEKTISVTPGETIQIQVGIPGKGGIGSNQVTQGQDGLGVVGNAGKNGSPGSSGESGKPGVIYIQWVGY